MRDHAVFDPEIETRSTSEQFELDRKRYLAQIQYLFSHSAFYRAKLTAAGFDTPEKVGDLSDIGALPFTEKDEIRETQANHGPFGAHLAADPSELRRVFSTSGTTGIPCYLGLTESDLKMYATNVARGYTAGGFKRGQRLVVGFNAGPFVAGAGYSGFD